MSFACPHTERAKVWVSASAFDLEPLQRRHLREQCRRCGRLFGQDFRHSLAGPDTLDADMAAAKRALEEEAAERERQWQQRREENEEWWRQQIDERQRDRDEEHEKWWDRYNTYLLTPEWQARRMLVFKRAGDVCEGCRERRATEIHHLTYRHVTNEFCWELVAICDACHTRVHAS